MSRNRVIKSVTRNGILFSRMLSPVGRNAQFCSAFYDVPLCEIAKINKRFAWLLFSRDIVSSESNKINVIMELLLVKHSLISLRIFDHDDITFLSSY